MLTLTIFMVGFKDLNFKAFGYEVVDFIETKIELKYSDDLNCCISLIGSTIYFLLSSIFDIIVRKIFAVRRKEKSDMTT